MDEEKGFKVIDRRGSTEDEKTRNDEKKVEATKINTNASEHEDTNFKLDFASFIMSLAHQTMVLLGEVPNPETNLVAMNLDAARQTIDILALLEEKTVGNLSEEEKRLIEEILTGLRMAYVKKSKISGV